MSTSIEIKLLSLKQVLIDGKAAGSVLTVLQSQPDLLDAMQAALDEHFTARIEEVQTALDASQGQLATLQAQLAPLPEYYLIAQLPVPTADGGTHAGILQPPKLGGAWLYDLLKTAATVGYLRLAADQQAPVGDEITTLADLTEANAAADIAAALAAAVAKAAEAAAVASAAATP